MSSPLQNNITNLQNLLDKVNALPEEVILPELTNPADASKALSGYEFINDDGEKVTGTIPTKTVSNLTANGATVTVPSGYYATQATKSVTTATQATPSVSIDSAGKITATATQTAGYVSAGTKTGTKQLTTQAAKTVTPSTSEQTAIASGVYATGAVKVAAIPSKYVDNSSVTAVESDVISGKKFGANGSVKTGTFSLDTELSTQDSLIAQIQAAVDNLPDAGSGGGESVETCKLTVVSNGVGAMIPSMYITRCNSNNIIETVQKFYSKNQSVVLLDKVVKGSIVTINNADNLVSASGDGITIDYLSTGEYVVCHVNTDAPDSVTVTLNNA